MLTSRAIPKHPENQNIGHLADDEGDHAADDDPQGLSEDHFELAIGHGRNLGRGDSHRDKDNDERIENQPDGHKSQAAHTGLPEILVDQVGRNEDDGPWDDSHAHDIRTYLEQLPAQNFAQDRVANKQSAQDEIDKVTPGIEVQDLSVDRRPGLN